MKANYMLPRVEMKFGDGEFIINAFPLPNSLDQFTNKLISAFYSIKDPITDPNHDVGIGEHLMGPYLIVLNKLILSENPQQGLAMVLSAIHIDAKKYKYDAAYIEDLVVKDGNYDAKIIFIQNN
jgi:hypothetical protein